MSGNVVPNATPISKTEYNLAISNLISALPSGILIYPFGSAGKKQKSNDIDVLIDVDQLMSIFNVNTEKECRIQLSNFFKTKNLFSARTGIIVHVGIPVNNSIVQVDLMVVKHAASIQKLHDHDYSTDSVNGKTIVSIWCDLTNMTSPNLMISPYKGLCDRTTKDLITSDKDKIAKIILSSSATATDMRSPQSLLNAVKHDKLKYNTIKEKYSL